MCPFGLWVTETAFLSIVLIFTNKTIIWLMEKINSRLIYNEKLLFYFFCSPIQSSSEWAPSQPNTKVKSCSFINAYYRQLNSALKDKYTQKWSECRSMTTHHRCKEHRLFLNSILNSMSSGDFGHTRQFVWSHFMFIFWLF